MSTASQFVLGMGLGLLAFIIVGPIIFLLVIKWMDFLADKIFKFKA